MWSHPSSVGKESAYNAGDPGSMTGSGRSTGERIGYPFQYSWASLVAQLVKNPPAMWEIWVQSLGWEDLLEKGKTTHSSILAWRIPWTTVHGVAKSWTRLSNFHFHFHMTLQSHSWACIWRIYAESIWSESILAPQCSLQHCLQ